MESTPTGPAPDVTPLPLLPHDVFFVLPSVGIWDDLYGQENPAPVESSRIIDASDSWIAQTYVHLRRRGLNVHFVPEFRAGEICVVTYSDISKRWVALKQPVWRSFLVVCQHDRPRPSICDHRIVQNKLNVRGPSDHWIPLWSQAGLRPRDPQRGTRLENLVYKGVDTNLAPPFRSEQFRQRLAELGVRLVTSERTVRQRQVDWTDYETADAVLAVRALSEYELSLKPATKLINAWLAGCPALLSPESPYRQLRRSELDFLEVQSTEDVLEAIHMLKGKPQLYQEMIGNGIERSREFAPDALARRWRDVLAGPVADAYQRWKSSSRTIAPARYVARLGRHWIRYKWHLARVKRRRRRSGR